MGKKGILNAKFADNQLAQMAGYRNRMIHYYDEITDREILKIIRENLKDFETFGQAVIKVVKNPKKYQLTIED